MLLRLRDNKPYKIRIGSDGTTKIDDIDELYYAIHNHPDNGCLTPPDLIGFCQRDNMLGIEAISNNGVHCYAIVKTVKYDSYGYMEHIRKRLDEFKQLHPDCDVQKDFDMINEFCIKLLKEGEQYGFKICG